MKKLLLESIEILCTSTFLGLFILFIGIYVYTSNMDNKTKFNQQYIKVTDDYDSSTGNIFDLLNQEDSLELLHNVYSKLCTLNYYEIMEQNIEYIGDYQCSEKFATNSSCINEIVNGEQLTSLKSIQLSEKCYEEFLLNNGLIAGRNLENKDYQFQDGKEIPVVLGNAYQSTYKIGDTFEGYYLSKRFIFCVVGMLKDNVQISLMDTDDTQDNYIFMPSLNIHDFSFNSLFDKILYSEKCNCFVVYKSQEEYNNILQQFREIKKKTGYKITDRSYYMNESENNVTVFGWDSSEAELLQFFHGLILIFVLCMFVFIEKKNRVKYVKKLISNGKKERYILLMHLRFSCTFYIRILISYVVAYSLVIWYTREKTGVVQYIKGTQPFLRMLLILFAILYAKLLTKNVYRLCDERGGVWEETSLPEK